MDAKPFRPLDKLRPPEPTPPEEICSCSEDKPLKLMTTLGHNPIHCVDCNLEIPLEELPLSTVLIDALADWNSLDSSIHRLWLDSGAYESWAEQELSDINSAVNSLGREVQRSVNELHRCYLWFFQDESAPDYRPLQRCPACEGDLKRYGGGIFEQLICDKCGIIVPGR